jgi:transcription elongation factor SPT5
MAIEPQGNAPAGGNTAIGAASNVASGATAAPNTTPEDPFPFPPQQDDSRGDAGDGSDKNSEDEDEDDNDNADDDNDDDDDNDEAPTKRVTQVSFEL